jgi:hypothetical protein
MAWPASPSTRSALFARVKLIMAADPAVERPATVQLSIDLNGRVIRAQAAGETMREAIHHACDRLRIRIERAARNWAAIRGGQPVPGSCEWRHRGRPSPQLPYFPPAARSAHRHAPQVVRGRCARPGTGAAAGGGRILTQGQPAEPPAGWPAGLPRPAGGATAPLRLDQGSRGLVAGMGMSATLRELRFRRHPDHDRMAGW